MKSFFGQKLKFSKMSSAVWRISATLSFDTIDIEIYQKVMKIYWRIFKKKNNDNKEKKGKRI